MSGRKAYTLLGAACVMAAVAGTSMATNSPRRLVTVDCTATGNGLAAGFADSFCEILGDEIARNRPPSAGPASIDVALARAGKFTISAIVTVRTGTGAGRSQDFSLSVRDSTLQPSVAKTLVYPVLKLLE